MRAAASKQGVEAALGASGQQLRWILDAVGEAVHCIDADGRLIFQNAASVELFGWRDEDLGGRNAHALMHHHRADGTPYPSEDCPIRSTLFDGRTRRIDDEIFFRKDGTSFPAEYVVSAMTDEQGAVTGAVISFRDTSERKRGEQLAAAERRILEKISSGQPIADILAQIIAAVEDDVPGGTGSVLLVDREAGRLRPGACPRLPPDFAAAMDGIPIGPAMGSCGTAAYRRAPVVVDDIAADPLWEGGRELALANGFRACWSLPVFDSTGDIVATFAMYFTTPRSPEARDLELMSRMTHLVGIGIEHRRTAETLAQSRRLQAVGELTGGVAHDFNNMLTVILGNAELLIDELERAGGSRDIAATIVEAAERGAELTQRLLAFARRQALEPKTVDINQLVSGMDNLLQRTIGEHVELRYACAANLWPALVDPGQLEHALLNLCLNARDAMQSGGRLMIETANETLDGEYAERDVDLLPGEYVMIAVSDTGVGISRDDLSRIFEPFFTTKARGKGTGLGLSMVYGFVKQSRGHIAVYSEPGQGTTVKMYLPRCVSGAAAHAARTSSDTEAAAGGLETILLVEDDELVRRYAREQLETMGYRIVEAKDGPTALDALARHDDIDLLFTDIVMPGGMTGRDLAKAAVASRPRLKVLYTSGYAREAIVHQGRLDPGVELLTKPYRRTELARRVRSILDRGEK